MRLLTITLTLFLLITGCKRELKSTIQESSLFSFIEAETIIPISSSTSYFHLMGQIEKGKEANIFIKLIKNETTAVAGTHYVETNDIRINFYGQTKMGYTIDLPPQNITEEVKMTFEVDKYELKPGAIAKTVVRLVPAKK